MTGREGYTQHGDYVFGWKGDSLQRALDSRCTNDWCEGLEYQETAEAEKCTIPRTVAEPVDGCESSCRGRVCMMNMTDSTC